jgi:poly-gamma-glutamate synthesis protein (capsule biosynthesis protein)
MDREQESILYDAPADASQGYDTPSHTREPVTVDLYAAGDVVVHEPVWNSGRAADGSFDFTQLFVHIADEARAADVALISQETMVGGTQLGLSGYPAFNGPQEIGARRWQLFYVMIKASIMSLNTGYAAIRFRTCLLATAPSEVLWLVCRHEDAYNHIYVYEKDGLRIAVLAYTYGTNGIPFSADNPWATHLLDEDAIRADSARAHESADLVVVWVHWGTEYQSDPDEQQRFYAQLFCDLGVDVVIGSHPHTIGPVDVLTRDDGHKTLVFYSLGNFLSNQIEGVMTSVGATVHVKFEKDAEGARVVSWELAPTVTQRGTGSNFAVWPLSDYTDACAAANDTQLTRQECEEFCSKVLGASYDQQTSTLRGEL